MRVAFLSFILGEYCVRLASALARDAEVLLMLPHGQADPYLPILDSAVTFQPFSAPRLRQPLRQLRMVSALIQQIKRFSPEVIHLQASHLWFNLALPFLPRSPLVLTIHDCWHHPGDRASQKTPQCVVDFARRRADQFIVHAMHVKQLVTGHYPIPPERVHVVPMIKVGNYTSQTYVRNTDHKVLFFGRIWEYKGLQYLIRAEPLITSQVPSAKIVIAGKGQDFARYRRIMVNPDNFIVYNEYIEPARCAELFQEASVVVLPYIEASQSGVIPVAYSFMRPVVTTTVGGLPELVEHGRTGYLVPPRDERALADAVVRLLRDDELRRRMGANGKTKIDTECSPQTVAEKTLTVYRHAINSACHGSNTYRHDSIC